MRILLILFLVLVTSTVLAQTHQPTFYHPIPKPKRLDGVQWTPTPEQHKANLMLMEMKRKGLLLSNPNPVQH